MGLLGQIIAGGIGGGAKAMGESTTERIKQEALAMREMNMARITNMYAKELQKEGFTHAERLQEVSQVGAKELAAARELNENIRQRERLTTAENAQAIELEGKFGLQATEQEGAMERLKKTETGLTERLEKVIGKDLSIANLQADTAHSRDWNKLQGDKELLARRLDADRDNLDFQMRENRITEQNRTQSSEYIALLQRSLQRDLAKDSHAFAKEMAGVNYQNELTLLGAKASYDKDKTNTEYTQRFMEAELALERSKSLVEFTAGLEKEAGNVTYKLYKDLQRIPGIDAQKAADIVTYSLSGDRDLQKAYVASLTQYMKNDTQNGIPLTAERMMEHRENAAEDSGYRPKGAPGKGRGADAFERIRAAVSAMGGNKGGGGLLGGVPDYPAAGPLALPPAETGGGIIENAGAGASPQYQPARQPRNAGFAQTIDLLGRNATISDEDRAARDAAEEEAAATSRRRMLPR